MTREEIIKGMEHCAEKLDTVANRNHGFNCIECPYIKKCEHVGSLIGLPLMRDAIALLKAQEPKPVHVTAIISNRKIGECPNCGKPINSGDYPRYCGDCGQAVKWE